jgi:hypothetical protein
LIKVLSIRLFIFLTIMALLIYSVWGLQSNIYKVWVDNTAVKLSDLTR